MSVGQAVRDLRVAAGLKRRGKPRHSDYARLSLLPRNKIAGITCENRRDGGGAQVHGQISIFAFSRATGIPFVYNPPRTIAHGTGPEWLSAWNQFIDFQSDIDSLPDDAQTSSPFEALRLYASYPTIVSTPHCHPFCDHDPTLYARVQDELRDRCSALQKRCNEGILAVHIRRGDAVSNPSQRFRLTSLKETAGAINAIKRENPELSLPNYTEGEKGDFALLPDYCEFHLNEYPLRTLEALLNAQVLLMAKSSFSYVAALLSRGTVLYQPFWHPQLPHWRRVNID